MSAELVGAILAGLAGLLAALREHGLVQSLRERVARLEARCDALERRP